MRTFFPEATEEDTEIPQTPRTRNRRASHYTATYGEAILAYKNIDTPHVTKSYRRGVPHAYLTVPGVHLLQIKAIYTVHATSPSYVHVKIFVDTEKGGFL
jgi:hypothetical protein